MRCPEDRRPGPTSRVQQRRDRVVDTARRLFAGNGFHATGMAQIARESGVAIGQIYRDFAAKEDIVAAIVERDCPGIMATEALHHPAGDGDVASARAWISHLLDPREKAEDIRLFAEIMAESTRNERIGGIFAGVQAEMRKNMLAALAQLAPEAPPGRRETLADTILTLSLGLLHHRLMRDDLRVEELTEALEAVVDREIAAIHA